MQKAASGIWEEVKRKKNVVGFDGVLKPRITLGKEIPGTECIRVYVSKKESIFALKEKDIVPRRINGVEIDVVEIGEVKAFSNRGKFRPAPSGVSAIFQGGSACTLGWFAADKLDDEPVVLANNHCTCDENRLSPGHPYLQPSPYDSGTPADQLGVLKRCVELNFDEFLCPYRNFLLRKLNPFYQETFNRVDLGIISVDPNDQLIEVFDLGSLNGKRRGEIGEEVWKVGRTTGVTQNGILSSNDWFGRVQYGRGVILRGPSGLIAGNNFSAGGDSSSAIVWPEDQEFGGLLYGGSDTTTVFDHWDLIEEDGQVEVIW